jgi:O-antigen/teichoic acid export membrane protein
VITLMTGTTIAQAIPIAVSPILTRLYSPNDFGVFALYMAVTSVLSVIATGRYEQVVMLPQGDEDAANVVVLSLIVSTFFSLILLVIVAIWNSPITALLGNPEISGWLYLIPFSILSMGAYNTFNYWLNRQKRFRTMSANRIMQGSITASGQVTLGFWETGPTGLIISFVVGWISAICFAARSYDYKAYPLRLSSIIAHAKLYKDYPRLSSPGALLDCASVQAPVFFLTRGYEVATVGFFSLAMRALSAPASIISTSVGQVFFQRISALIHSGHEKISSEVFSTAKKLAVVAAVTFIPFMILGGDIFGFIFGEKWRTAGEYVTILSPALFVRFVVSPLSSLLLATGNVRLSALWQTLYFISSIIVMSILIGHSVTVFLAGFVINEIAMYALYFYLIIIASKRVKIR